MPIVKPFSLLPEVKEESGIVKPFGSDDKEQKGYLVKPYGAAPEEFKAIPSPKDVLADEDKRSWLWRMFEPKDIGGADWLGGRQVGKMLDPIFEKTLNKLYEYVKNPESWEVSNDDIFKPLVAPGSPGVTFALGKHLGNLDQTIGKIATGEPEEREEAMKGLAKDLAWLSLYGAPKVLIPGLKMAARTINAGHKNAKIPARYIKTLVEQAIPKPYRPWEWGGYGWERVIVPLVNKEFIPTYAFKAGRPVRDFGGQHWKKSIAQIGQPAVERLAKVPMGKGTRASSFRKVQAKKAQMIEATGRLEEVIQKASPKLKWDISRILSGMPAFTKEGKAIGQAFIKDVKAVKLPPTYQKAFQEGLKKYLGKEIAAVKTPMAPGHKIKAYNAFEKLDKALTGDFKPKEARKALKSLVEDPLIDNDLRQMSMDLINLSSDTVSAVTHAFNSATESFLIANVKRMGAVKLDAKAVARAGHELKKYTPSKIKQFEGMLVDKDVELELRTLKRVQELSSHWFNKWFMTIWKTNKVILRGATHARNLISNVILNDWGGLPFYRGDIYWQAAKEMKSKGRIWQEWKSITGGGGTFSSTELAEFSRSLRYPTNGFDKALHLFDSFAAKPRSWYSMEEQYAKMAKFIWNKKRGMTPSDAALDAMKWTFNYSEITRASAIMRSTAAPFFTWQSKVLPLMAETVVKHPIRFAKWPMAMMGVQKLALNRLSISDGEWDFIKSILPDYIQDGMFYLIPMRDAKGRLQLLNMTYIFPGLGDIFEMSNEPGGLLFGNPIISIAATIQSETRHSGAPLYHEWESGQMKMIKTFGYVWEQLMPTWMPGATGWNSFWDTASNKPDAPTWAQAAASSIGLKVTPIDPAREYRKKDVRQSVELQQRKSVLNKALRNARNTSERSKAIRKYFKSREEYEKGKAF